MLVPDANILLHAVNADARAHERARGWLVEALSEQRTVGFAWPVLIAFLRVATHPSIFARPLTTEQGFDQLQGWLAATPATIVEPTRRHLSLLRGLLAGAGTAGNLVNDAQLAALALEHDATVASFDRDFARFEGLRFELLA